MGYPTKSELFGTQVKVRKFTLGLSLGRRLKVHPELCFLSPSLKAGLRAAEGGE